MELFWNALFILEKNLSCSGPNPIEQVFPLFFSIFPSILVFNPLLPLQRLH